jgi:hypothetical protein
LWLCGCGCGWVMGGGWVEVGVWCVVGGGSQLLNSQLVRFRRDALRMATSQLVRKSGRLGVRRGALRRAARAARPVPGRVRRGFGGRRVELTGRRGWWQSETGPRRFFRPQIVVRTIAALLVHYRFDERLRSQRLARLGVVGRPLQVLGHTIAHVGELEAGRAEAGRAAASLVVLFTSVNVLRPVTSDTRPMSGQSWISSVMTGH